MRFFIDTMISLNHGEIVRINAEHQHCLYEWRSDDQLFQRAQWTGE